MLAVLGLLIVLCEPSVQFVFTSAKAGAGAIIAENKIAEHKTRPLITNIFKNVFIDF
jgi:hypothetical protein